MHLLMLVVVSAVITEGTFGVDCPPGTVKMGGGLCEALDTGRRAASDSFEDTFKDINNFCPQGAVKTDDGQCTQPLRRSADDSNCPPGTAKTDDGLKCMVIGGRRAADASIKDISDEPYCPKGKFYLKGDCVGRGRRAADVNYCPPGTVKADSGQCIVIGRRAYDVSKSKDGSDGSEEPHCPLGSFYHNGQCWPLN